MRKKLIVEKKDKDCAILYCRGVDKTVFAKAKEAAKNLGYKSFSEFINKLLRLYLEDNGVK